ncbi:MAG: DNRLRE domain-containing protein [Planctomycetes bacterium]|nr:DNRLRE domain-containing protein [Planctomycetota bacterium]
MAAVHGPMSETILYCEKCGKLIPPEEAEAEDFALIGGAPVCPACLAKTDPDRKKRFDTARHTRLVKRIKTKEDLGVAVPPRQTFPAPSTYEPDTATRTEVKLLREEILAELQSDFETKDKLPAAKADAGANEELEPMPPDEASAALAAELQPQGLPRPTRIALWALLLASLAVVIWLMFAPPQPAGTATPETAEAPSADVPAAKPDAKPALPPANASKAPAAVQDPEELDEVRTIVTLTGKSPGISAAQAAIERLEVIAAAGRDPAKTLAAQYVAAYRSHIDALARQDAREAAERAEVQAAREQYAPAAKILTAALDALPEASAWARGDGREQLQALIDALPDRKAKALAERSGALDAALNAGDLEKARAAGQALASHADPEFAALGAQALQRVQQAEAARAAEAAERAQAVRDAWPVFFQSFDAALGAGDFTAAKKLCRPEKDAPLLAAGREANEKLLDGWFAEAEAAERLFEAVLEAARKRTGQTVALPMAQDTVRGKLAGVENRQILVEVDGKAQVKVPADKITLEGLAGLLGAAREPGRSKYGPALWALGFAQGTLARAGEDSAAVLEADYAAIGQKLPPHWARRFEAERTNSARGKFDALAAQLRDAVAAKRLEEIRALRAQIAEVLPDLKEGPGKDEAELLREADKLAGRAQVKHVVFQNGRLPTAEFVGIRIDQINKYYKNAHRTDVDVRTGLKLGSFNDVQRVLLRFDGLSAMLGNGKVRKATLELYQVPSKQAKGAEVGLYRLQKGWMPDAGSWNNADERRKVAWQKPGASGDLDASPQPDATLKLDHQQNLWRTWDVTVYVTDLLSGKEKNLGLLLRLAENEPAFDVRFYPDEGMDNPNEPKFRPRLVVEVETVE